MKLPRVAIGIDIGTTNCRVGVWQNGKVDIIAHDQVNGDGDGSIPSYVAFMDTHRLVGEGAKSQIATNPTNTIVNVKRVIGRKYDDPKLRNDMKQWPFKVVEYEGGPMIEVDLKMGETRRLTPEQVTAMILAKVKETAESVLGLEVTDAVITVPANFNDSQRQATMDAASIAGLKVIHIINEPTAAALTYGLLQKNSGRMEGDEKNVLVFDLGGGKLDVSIVTINEGSLFEVRATSGDTQLGGQDFDSRLLTHLAQEFKRKYGKDLMTGHLGSIKKERALRRLRTACEQTKKILSTSTEASVDIEVLLDETDFNTKISRVRFEELCSDLFKSTVDHVDRVLALAKMEQGQIDDVLLVGGSTRIPRIQKLLQDHFNGRIKIIDQVTMINPNSAVVYGAAVQAAIRSAHPFSQSEAVVPQEILVVDVAPLSCSIEHQADNGGGMKTIVQQNSRIPSTHTHTFTTFYDQQPTLSFQIFEGGPEDDPMTANVLGTFTLVGIPPAVKGWPQIKVTFVMDSNGIIHVQTANDPDHRQQVTVESDKGRLTKKEIERMMKDARMFEAEDEEERVRVAAKNRLEFYLLRVKRAIQDLGDNSSDVSPMHRRKVVRKCGRVLKWLDDANNQLRTKEEFESKFKQVQTQFQPIVARLMDVRGHDDQEEEEGFHHCIDENSNCIAGPSEEMMEL